MLKARSNANKVKELNRAHLSPSCRIHNQYIMLNAFPRNIIVSGKVVGCVYLLQQWELEKMLHGLRLGAAVTIQSPLSKLFIL